MKLTHEFVDYIPDDLRGGTIYISIPFATAVHKCCCGCGNEVITPLSPTDWTLIFDGNSVSLDPSIGNWSFTCQSHYWIINDRVEWARRWTAREIAAGRANDRLAKAQHYATKRTQNATPSADDERRDRRWWRKLLRWW